MASLARRRPTRVYTAPRRSGAATAKWKARVSAVRAAAKRAKSKSEKRNLIVALGTGAAVGALNRRNVELPFAGEVGSAGILAAASYVLGAYAVKGKMSAVLQEVGATAGAIAIHELVEDSELFSFLD